MRRCIQLACSDPSQCAGGAAENVTVAIVGDCPSCAPGGLELNSFAFRELAGWGPDLLPSLAVEWAFVPCDPLGEVYPAQASTCSAARAMHAACTLPGQQLSC